LPAELRKCTRRAGCAIVRKCPVDLSPDNKDTTMDAVNINQIGTQLSDLSARTQELRGYL